MLLLERNKMICIKKDTDKNINENLSIKLSIQLICEDVNDDIKKIFDFIDHQSNHTNYIYNFLFSLVQLLPDVTSHNHFFILVIHYCKEIFLGGKD